MHKKILFLIWFCFLFVGNIFSQVENVPLENHVYEYLKQMSVKGVLPSINDDNPNLSRGEVVSFLKSLDTQRTSLNKTEIKILEKYKNEFFFEEANSKNSAELFGKYNSFSDRMKEVFGSQKEKYIYTYKNKDNNFILNGLGHIYFADELKPNKGRKSFLSDFGYRAGGTLFGHLGYKMGLILGSTSYDPEMATIIEPKLKSNFKFNENIEKLRSYDFTDGYVKYYTDLQDNMSLSIQLGREKISYGLGYSNSLMLSGLQPDLDFIKFNYKWGIINFSSIYASGVGPFTFARDSDYTKYISLNRLKVSIKNVIDIGAMESVVFNRFEIGYLTPVGFYKMIEMSIQDRDNGTFGLDFQTHFIKGVEIQGSLFLDENVIFDLDKLKTHINKTAYQIGTYIYEPAGIKNLSVIAEYTKIRPFTYTHTSIVNNYTSYNVILGHPIGPNSDQIFTKISYNLNEWLTFLFGYQRIRTGKNIYDANGNLIKNVGSDVWLAHNKTMPDEAPFLDGERINTDLINAGIRVEPIRNIIFDFTFNYRRDNNITKNFKEDMSYGLIKMSVDY